MRKVLLACTALLAAFFAMGPASASAAPAPQAVVCLGAVTDNNGSFVTQEIHTGQLPEVGIGLTQNLCLVLNPAAGQEFLTGLSEDLSEAEPPSEPPTEEEIQAIVEALEGFDPSNPLAALLLANTICQNTGLTDYCNALIGGALTAPVPLGQVTLDGESGSCFGGVQSGTGQVSGGGGDRFDLDWTADYESRIAGVISGTATNDQFGSPNRGDESELTGVIAPGCGQGGKALVLFIN